MQIRLLSTLFFHLFYSLSILTIYYHFYKTSALKSAVTIHINCPGVETSVSSLKPPLSCRSDQQVQQCEISLHNRLEHPGGRGTEEGGGAEEAERETMAGDYCCEVLRSYANWFCVAKGSDAAAIGSRAWWGRKSLRAACTRLFGGVLTVMDKEILISGPGLPCH